MATESKEPKQAAEKKNDDPHIEVAELKLGAEVKAEAKPAAVKPVEPEKTAESAEPAQPAAAKPAEHHETKAAPKPEAKQAARPHESISRVGRAEAIIRRNVLWSIGAGVVPLPLFDIVAVTGIEVKMLSELSDLYNVLFVEDIAKKLIGSLLGGFLGFGFGAFIGGSLAKLVPVVGMVLGAVSVPIFAGAFTWALGKVFLMHFEAGGTLLDFDPHAMRSYFKQEFEKAKVHVADAHKEAQARAAKSP